MEGGRGRKRCRVGEGGKKRRREGERERFKHKQGRRVERQRQELSLKAAKIITNLICFLQ